MNEDTYRDKLNDLQLEVEELRAKLKEAQTGDLISRQAALDALDGVSWMHLEGKHEICDGDWIKDDEAEEALKQLPSVQPKIKCIANVTLTDKQVKEAFEKAKCEILAAQPDHIRCRDCKYAEFKPGATIHCKVLSTDLYQWDYCSYAERNDDE